MAPPPNSTFVQICRSAKITTVVAAQRLSFLRDAGLPTSDQTSAKILAERCAAIAWARDSLANSEDPDSWSTALPAAQLAHLQSLHVLPPYRGAAPLPSNLRRLADVIATYTPIDPAAAAAPPPPQPAADGINIARPDGQGGAAPPPPQPLPTARAAAAPSPPGEAVAAAPRLPSPRPSSANG
jgi:hypothetical protein